MIQVYLGGAQLELHTTSSYTISPCTLVARVRGTKMLAHEVARQGNGLPPSHAINSVRYAILRQR